MLNEVRLCSRYLEIMKAEGLEISQPALDPNSAEVHHRITLRHPRLTAHKYVLLSLFFFLVDLDYCGSFRLTSYSLSTEFMILFYLLITSFSSFNNNQKLKSKNQVFTFHFSL